MPSRSSRLFLEKQLALFHFAFQPRVYLVDFPVQDNGIDNAQQKFQANGIDNAQQKFQANPQVIVAL